MPLSSQIILKLYGNDKSAFWKEMMKKSKEVGSWQELTIPAEGPHGDHTLKLILNEYIPGSGEYPFSIEAK